MLSFTLTLLDQSIINKFTSPGSGYPAPAIISTNKRASLLAQPELSALFEALLMIERNNTDMNIVADRFSAWDVAPEDMSAMLKIEAQIGKSSLDPTIIELVKMRASQINGCAFCLAMHSATARKDGETEERLYLLNAWWESTLYTDKEKAALAWTEALTNIAETHAPDEVYDMVREQYTEEEIASLTLLICQINSWNRFAISLRYKHN